MEVFFNFMKGPGVEIACVFFQVFFLGNGIE